MEVLAIILPVLTMILLGFVFRKTKMLSKDCVSGLKFLASKVMLPVSVFHAIATASLDGGTVILEIIMLVMLVTTFGIGFFMRRFMEEPYRRYIPFMVCVYEGGMLAYPLYTSICGMENLANIAILDIAGILFGFSVYTGLLSQVDEPGKVDVKRLIKDAFKNPLFIAALAGLFFHFTGLIEVLLASPFGNTYLSVKDMVTSGLSALILIAVGYDFRPDMEMLKPCLKAIFLRAALQVVMAFLVLTAVHQFIGYDSLQDLALILYMSAPCSFVIPSFVKNEKGSVFVSTTSSLYCILSLIVYAVVAFAVK